MIWRAQALRQAGYCDACEFMTTAQAAERLVADRKALYRMAARGKLRKVKISARALWHRAEIEGVSAQWTREGRGLFGLPHPRSI